MTLYVSIVKALMFPLCIAPEISLLSNSLNDDDLSLNVILKAL